MRWKILGLAGACLALSGCDRVQGLLRAEVMRKAPPGEVKIGGAVADEWAPLVQRDEAGAVKFRRDLDFPQAIEVRMTERTKFSQVRAMRQSAFGAQPMTLEGEFESVLLGSKGPGVFSFELEKVAERVLTEQEKKQQGKKPVAKKEPTVGVRFGLTTAGWKPQSRGGSSDFKAVVLADALKESVPQMMVQFAAHPRVQWFSGSRSWSKGDQVTLTGTALKILEPFDVGGRVVLTYVGEEAVGGHPCGVFEVEGDLDVKSMPAYDGSLVDADVSITSGKIWASLIYPILLREEYDTVQSRTVKASPTAKSGDKEQGGYGIMRVRSWLPVQ